MKARIPVSLLAILALFAGFGGQVTHAAPGDPPITIYVVPTITDEKILSDTALPDSYISNEIYIAASPGEYEPASFVIKALDDIASLEVVATDLEGGGSSIPASSVDIRVVKVWYQAGYSVWPPDISHKHLTPELLLKDDSLVKVENEENYLKKLDGTYMWISDPTRTSDPYRPRTFDEIPVEDSPTLQPVDIPAGTNKQFWITVEVPEGASDGVYTGNIELRTGAEIIGQLQLSLQVLPIELLEPYLEYSIYYVGRLNNNYPDGTMSHAYRSEQQIRSDLEDMISHGITNPMTYQGTWEDPVDTELLGRWLAIRNEVGIGNQPLYYLGLGYAGQEILDISQVPQILSTAQSHGVPEVYFYGIDECLATRGVDALLSQRPTWEQVHTLGGKIYVAGIRVGQYSDDRSPGEFGFVGDLLDLMVCNGPPSSEEAARWHSIGHRIFCYANPQVGEEKPETYRRNYGLLLWQADYDGAMDYAYNLDYGNPWNDFDCDARGCMFGYPTIDGVTGTLQWEGWREGVDDVRYLTTLLEAIERGKDEGKDTSAAEAWLANLKSSDLTTQNLDSVRSEMIDYILALQNHPPVLGSIGNKTITGGQVLVFTVLADDADSDPLTYSANLTSLPPEAGFNPATQTFSWTPGSGEAGTYPDVHFEVSDGELTDSENITITVNTASTPPPSGGGGGTGGGGVTGFTNVTESTTSTGQFIEDVTAKSADGKVELIITESTIGQNRKGYRLTSVSLKEKASSPDSPQSSEIIGKIYEIGPSGATFDPPIELTFKYDDTQIPQGVAEKNLVIVVHDPDTRQWQELESIVDAENDTVTAKLSHLSTFAVLASTRPARFEVSNFSLTPEEVDSGGDISINVLVTNTGDLTESYQVSLKLDDVVIQTKEVTLDGGDSKIVSFSATSYTVGEHKAGIGDSQAIFTVKAPKAPDAATTPVAAPAAPTTSTPHITPNEVRAPPPVAEEASSAEPGVSHFSVTPIYDTPTSQLISARIDYQINKPEELPPEAELILRVFLDREPLEEVLLLALSQLQPDGNTGSLGYIPSMGWDTGTYIFQAELYEGERLVQSTDPKKFKVTPESITKAARWGNLYVMIGGTVILIIIVIVALILSRKRDMPRDHTHET